VYLFDVNETSVEDLSSTALQLQSDGRKFLLVGNKSDLVSEVVAKSTFETIPGVILISAKAGKHIEVLKERLVDMVLQGTVQTEDTMITNARHFHALQEMNRSLQDIISGLDRGIFSDLVALDIRRCLQFLGEITGEITTEDQLDYIFSKFCIGK
jgi:tRNA modification GTPase